uniref:Uncharacterized protein n=1 Tax=Magallana gigas TaxID=29159 RepID=K1R0F3_MAGGI
MTAQEVEEQEKSFAGIITSIDFDSGLANVEVKGIEESILIPPALLQELFPTNKDRPPLVRQDKRGNARVLFEETLFLCKLDPEKGECIMFDIETTGLSRDSDIVQLSAFDGIT